MNTNPEILISNAENDDYTENNQIAESLEYLGDEDTPTHFHVVTYEPAALHKYAPKTVSEILEITENDDLNTWIQVHGLTDLKLFGELCDALGIDFLTQQDILNPEHLTKIEEHEKYLLLITKIFTQGTPDEFDQEQVCIVLKNKTVISFFETENDLFQDVGDALDKNARQIRTRGADYLYIVLMNSIIGNHIDTVKQLDDALESLEDSLLTFKNRPNISADIQHERRKYIQLKRFLPPLLDQYGKLVLHSSHLIHKNLRPFINDVYDHIQYTVQNLDNCRETLAALATLYISNTDTRLNDIMKRLTIVSTIFIPLTFLAGVWGMNFSAMPELTWQYGYLFAWASFILLALIVSLFLRRIDWK